MITIRQFVSAWSIRHSFGNNDKKRDKGQTTPDNILRYDNIVYGKDERYAKWQLLDVYRPRAQEGEELHKLPVIVSVHGGAWVYGDKDRYQFYCMNLAKRGFAVVNFSYRLAPEVKFPASLQDTARVFDWVYDNAEQYGFDLDRLFAVGDSAGAHLLTMYADALTNKAFGKQFDFINSERIHLKGVALNNGKYRLDDEDSKIKLLLSGLMPNGGTEEEIKLLDAASHVTAAFPPAYVMTCVGDFIRPQSTIIKEALEAAGVKHIFKCYGTEEKPLWHVFHCDPKLEEAALCNDEECAFFRSL